jgi:hypothetical protein
LEKGASISGYFNNFKKLPKENNRPIGENSLNLVTPVAILPRKLRKLCRNPIKRGRDKKGGLA